MQSISKNSIVDKPQHSCPGCGKRQKRWAGVGVCVLKDASIPYVLCERCFAAAQDPDQQKALLRRIEARLVGTAREAAAAQADPKWWRAHLDRLPPEMDRWRPYLEQLPPSLILNTIVVAAGSGLSTEIIGQGFVDAVKFGEQPAHRCAVCFRWVRKHEFLPVACVLEDRIEFVAVCDRCERRYSDEELTRRVGTYVKEIER